MPEQSKFEELFEKVHGVSLDDVCNNEHLTKVVGEEIARRRGIVLEEPELPIEEVEEEIEEILEKW